MLARLNMKNLELIGETLNFAIIYFKNSTKTQSTIKEKTRVTYSVYLPDLSIKASNFKAKRNTFTYINCSGSYFVHWLK